LGFYGKLGAARHLLQTYVTALSSIVYRSSLPLIVDPRESQKFLHQVLSAQDLEADDPVLGSVAIADLLPDYSPWHGQCDFVWVDACHDYPVVVQDTRAALRLRHNRGWIAWHDYRHTTWWSGVTRAVRELARSHPGVRHIRGTTVAV
jgi:hypothetical protein